MAAISFTDANAGINFSVTTFTTDELTIEFEIGSSLSGTNPVDTINSSSLFITDSTGNSNWVNEGYNKYEPLDWTLGGHSVYGINTESRGDWVGIVDWVNIVFENELLSGDLVDSTGSTASITLSAIGLFSPENLEGPLVLNWNSWDDTDRRLQSEDSGLTAIPELNITSLAPGLICLILAMRRHRIG